MQPYLITNIVIFKIIVVFTDGQLQYYTAAFGASEVGCKKQMVRQVAGLDHCTVCISAEEEENETDSYG